MLSREHNSCRLLALETFQTGVYSVKQEMSPCWAFIQKEQHEGEEITEFHFWLNYIFNEWRNGHKLWSHIELLHSTYIMFEIIQFYY